MLFFGKNFFQRCREDICDPGIAVIDSDDPVVAEQPGHIFREPDRVDVRGPFRIPEGVSVRNDIGDHGEVSRILLSGAGNDLQILIDPKHRSLPFLAFGSGHQRLLVERSAGFRRLNITDHRVADRHGAGPVSCVIPDRHQGLPPGPGGSFLIRLRGRFCLRFGPGSQRRSGQGKRSRQNESHGFE